MVVKVLLAALSFAALSIAAGPQNRRAPDLAIQAINSRELSLNSFKGKVVALEFILTTCSHCQQSCMALNKMHREFGAQGFTPIAVAINDDATFEIPGFLKKFALTFPVGWQRRETAITFMQHPVMQTMMMPQLAFVDREGMVRAQFAGNDKFFDNQEVNMREQIKALLTPGAGAKKAAPAAKKK